MSLAETISDPVWSPITQEMPLEKDPDNIWTSKHVSTHPSKGAVDFKETLQALESSLGDIYQRCNSFMQSIEAELKNIVSIEQQETAKILVNANIIRQLDSTSKGKMSRLPEMALASKTHNHVTMNPSDTQQSPGIEPSLTSSETNTVSLLFRDTWLC
jgi:hypothetical protein